MAQSVADQLVATLGEAGVKRIYGVAGDSLNAITDSGTRGIRIEDPADVERAIGEAFAHDGPVLVDALVNRQELSMPPKITAEMAKGFGLFMVKAILNGRSDEVIDLARTNLWR